MTMAQFFFLVAFIYAAQGESKDAARLGAIIMIVLGTICYFFA